MPIRLGAVSYLNARPLVYGLEQPSRRFDVRYDVPSRCATLLHDNQVDLGLIPSIEYLRGADYRIVPGVAIASNGPVASVALFSPLDTADIRTIALDISSRTSVALLKVLCRKWFEIDPAFVPMAPDLSEMLNACDGALVIGDNALFAEHEATGLNKTDLGEEWAGMTGLPFVYAFWAGRPGVVAPDDIATLQETRDIGVANVDKIAGSEFPADARKADIAARYLRENIQYALDEAEAAGLRKFYELAASVGAVPASRPPSFY
jgi:chorismate dehydratase